MPTVRCQQRALFFFVFFFKDNEPRALFGLADVPRVERCSNHENLVDRERERVARIERNVVIYYPSRMAHIGIANDHIWETGARG